MENSERTLSNGACILVKDKSLLEGWDSPIYKLLEDEGFESWHQKGVYSGVNWVFINIVTKIFAPGMPGVSLGRVFGNHAVTWDEFLTIYNIYKKYEGKGLMEMVEGDS